MRSSLISIKHVMWITIGISLLIGYYFFDRLNLNWMLWIYALGAVVIGVMIFRDDIEASFLVDKNKMLGPSYWGLYQDADKHEDPSELRIKPPKPCKDIDGVVGSGNYANGKAVKSAR